MSVSAQDYNEYLQLAYKHLKEGNTEKAQKAYDVYRKLSGYIDSVVEDALEAVLKNDWKYQCDIIDLGNREFLAVQKIDPSQVKLLQDDAKTRCESNRLGGFNDWRLPSYEELNTILSMLNIPINSFFWTSYHKFSEEGNKNSDRYLCRDEWIAINNSGEINRVILQGGWSSIYMKSAVFINGKEVSKYKDALPKYNYVIVRRFSN